MSIQLQKMLPRPLVTDLEGNTLTGDQLTFTEAPQIKTALRFIPRTAPPSDRYSVKEGSVYYDVDDKTFYYYDGSSWLPLVTAVGGTPLFSPSTDNRLVRFNGASGAIQDSAVTLSDAGDMTGVNALTATTSISTPSLTTAGTAITLNSKSLTNVNDVSATTASFTGKVFLKTLDDIGTTGISFSNSQVSGISTLKCTVAEVDQYIGPRISYGDALLIDGPNTISLAPANGIIDFPLNNTMQNLTVLTNLSASTQLSTPKLTSATSGINIDGKNLTNVGGVTAGSVSSNSFTIATSADMVFTAGVGNNFVMTNGDSTQVKKLIYTVAGSGTELAYWQISGEPVKRVSKFGDGWAFTNGVSGGGALTGFVNFWTTPLVSGAFNFGATAKNDGNGLLYAKSLIATSADATIQSSNTNGNVQLAPNGTGKVVIQNTNATIGTSGGDLTITPGGNLVLNNIVNLTASTQVSTPKITSSGSTVDFDSKTLTGITESRAGFVKAKYGGNVFYSCPVTMFNNYYNVDVAAGSPTAQTTITLPASLMAGAGDKLFVRVSGTGASTLNARRIGLVVNACTEQNFTLATSTGAYWTVEFECVRVTATSCDIYGRGFSGTLSPNFGNASLTCNTFGSAGSIVVNITSTTTGDVKLRNVMCVFYPQYT